MRGLFLLGWLFLIVFLLWPLLVRLFPRSGRPSAAPRPPRTIRDELVKDPVCQMYVVRSRAVIREVGGTTHYFCSRECAGRFAAIRGEG